MKFFRAIYFFVFLWLVGVGYAQLMEGNLELRVLFFSFINATGDKDIQILPSVITDSIISSMTKDFVFRRVYLKEGDKDKDRIKICLKKEKKCLAFLDKVAKKEIKPDVIVFGFFKYKDKSKRYIEVYTFLYEAKEKKLIELEPVVGENSKLFFLVSDSIGRKIVSSILKSPSILSLYRRNVRQVLEYREFGRKIYYFKNPIKFEIKVKAPSYVEYSINGSDFRREARKLEREGIYLIIYKIVGEYGKSKYGKVSIVIDKTPPVVYARLTKLPINIKEALYYPKGTKLMLYAYDILSPIKEIEYSYDGKIFYRYKKPISLEEIQKKYNSSIVRVYFRARDFAGNISKKYTVDVYVDTKPPLIKIAAFRKGKEVIYTTSREPIIISALDKESGLKGIFYKVDGEEMFRRYKLPIYLSSGEHIITVKAVDNAGNEREIKKKIIVDDVPPITQAFIK